MKDSTVTSLCNALPPLKEKTVPEFILERAKHFADQGQSHYIENGITGEKRYFKDLEGQSRKVASHFYKKGLRKGDIVIYNTVHQMDQVLLMMGVWRANGTLRSLYADESAETVLEKLSESQARWIFCDAENVHVCQKIANEVNWPVEVVVCGPGEDGFANITEYYNDDGKSCPELDLCEDDMSMIMPTSGTTGASKGAMHTHKSVVLAVRLWSKLPFTSKKANILASKGTHISGAWLPLATLAKGVLAIVLHKINKEILIQTVDKYKPGTAFAFPSFLLAMGTADAEGYDVASIETVITGGSPITSEMNKAFYALPSVKSVVIAYGLTEGANTAVTFDYRENGTQDAYSDVPDTSVGRPYPGGQLQIRALDTLEVLGSNQRGEVCTRGEFLFSGYYKNPQATKDAFVDGWFRTGDVGYVDDNGFLFIVDRAKDIFKYFHNHISPTELEAVIAEHPHVKEVCVFPIPDEGGEVPRAFVVLKNPNGQNLSVLAEEIKKFADTKLATYKQLKGGLYIVKDFPKGKTGKVARNIVAQMEIPEY